MMQFTHDTIGGVHLITALLSFVLGTMVLVTKKGTGFHKKTGYAYVIAMLLVNITAFMIYRLFGGFGLFHIAAIVSLASIILGMIPILRKKKKKDWRVHHFSWMYWSVIGLYAAFASEVLTRVPETPFFAMVGVATGVIMLGGSIIFRKNKDKWAKAFGGF